MHFLSEIEQGERIPAGKLAYLAERARNRFYDFILGKFEAAERKGFTQAELAKRIGKTPPQINRMLGAPGNWTIETICALLVGICGEEIEPASRTLLGRSERNMQKPEWMPDENAASAGFQFISVKPHETIFKSEMRIAINP
jgi:transcriptional regulator with XRE-family HTH domain